MNQSALTYLCRVGVLFVLYVGTARLGLKLDAVSGFATPVWPPTGIALAALYLFGCRLWPGIAAAAFLVNLERGAPLVALGIAAGNTGEALLGASLLRRATGSRNSLERVRDVLALVILAGLLSTLLSATVGVTSGWWLGGIPSHAYSKTWWTWWIGDALGNLVVAPLLLAWAHPSPRAVSTQQILYAGLLTACLTLVGLSIFSGRLTTSLTNEAYLIFPILIWAALALQSRGAATGIFLVSVIAVWGTVRGLGPFAGPPRTESLLGLQIFMGIVAVTILVLAADVAERRQAQEALGKTRDQLEKRVLTRTEELSQINAALADEIRTRTQIEESLRSSERRLAEAQAIAHLGSWEWDIATDEISWSKELYRIFGLDPSEGPMTYEQYLTYLHPEDRKLATETIQQSYGDHQPFEFDHRVVHPDGTERWVHGQGALVTDDLGRPVRMLGTALDITERKLAEVEIRRARDDLEIRVRERTAELERANRAKDQFLAMLAHELRNPVASLLSAAQLLSRLPPSDPRFVRANETIQRQVNHQARLLEDLLNVSRLEQGKIDLHRQVLDLSRLLQDTAEDYRPVLDTAGLSFETDLPDHPVWINGDSTRLAQVVSNLLQNAVRFSDPGGRVTLRLSTETEFSPAGPIPCAAVAVRDTGTGIDSDLLPHIFEPFTQADLSLDRSRGGLGLGLALVKQLVELHGGYARASSEGVGRGAQFTVMLPVAPAPTAPADRKEQPRPTASVRLLIVEDNADAAQSLRDLLELSGCTVQIAVSGQAALEIAPQFLPDLVLCDLGLPGMDGYQVAAALRGNPVTAGARLIALSGYGQEEHQRRSAEAGFERHLLKPVNLEELHRLLQNSPPLHAPADEPHA